MSRSGISPVICCGRPTGIPGPCTACIRAPMSPAIPPRPSHRHLSAGRGAREEQLQRITQLVRSLSGEPRLLGVCAQTDPAEVAWRMLEGLHDEDSGELRPEARPWVQHVEAALDVLDGQEMHRRTLWLAVPLSTDTVGRRGMVAPVCGPGRVRELSDALGLQPSPVSGRDVARAREKAVQIEAQMAGAVPFRPVRPAEIVWLVQHALHRGLPEPLLSEATASSLYAGRVREGCSPRPATPISVRSVLRKAARPAPGGLLASAPGGVACSRGPGYRGRGDGPAVVEGCRLADPAPVAAGRVPGRHRLSGASGARRGAAGRLRAGRRLVRAAGSPRLPGRLRRESVAGGGRGGPPARSSASAPSSSTRSTSTTPAPPGCPPIFPRPPAIWARWTPAWPAPPPRSRSSRSPCSPVWAPAAELCDARARARWRSCSRGPTTGSCAPSACKAICSCSVCPEVSDR